MDNGKKNSVLIVDDEASNLKILYEYLSPEYTIYMAKNGPAAIELARRDMPDLILLDIIMPEMSGFDVIDILKKDPKTTGIPVIFVTGLDSVKDEERGMASGAADFIHKPLSKVNVKLRVQNQIQIVNQIREIKQYANEMEAIINCYKGIIWCIDTEEKITTFSGQYIKDIGVDSNTLIGKTLEVARGINKYIDIINDGKINFNEGSKAWDSEIDNKKFRSHTMPMVDDDGNVTGIVGSSDDVTELVELHAEINAAQAKSKFFAKMSHEMRTPLNAVIGLSEIILDEGGLSEEAVENIEKINSSGASLLCLVNDILDISKMDAGKLEVIEVEYDTPGMLSDVVTQNLMRKKTKPIEFIISIGNNIPSALFGDDNRVKQLLSNLLSNAFKYTMEGVVELIISAEPHNDDSIMLSMAVKDTGIGIKKENIGSLFSDYAQMDAIKNRTIEGTGLGLAITKTMAEMMGGGILVESEYGKGSTFTVKVPQKKTGDKVIPPEVIESLKSFQYHGRKRAGSGATHVKVPYAHVLVVDDVLVNLDVARGMMKPYKMKVDTVTSGQAAIDAVREGQIKYDVIFMDHMMPEIDGIEAARIIREEIGTEYAKTVPIIALTANALTGNEQMFLSKGFQAFVTKPIESRRLDEIINEFLYNEEKEKNYIPDAAEEETTSAADGEEKKLNALEGKIEGMSIKEGLTRFGGDSHTYLNIVESFVKNTPRLVDTLRSVTKENLHEYAINVHGVKSSCRGICCENAGGQAEALEHAAKAGNLDFVTEKNAAFIELVMKLVNDIDKAFNFAGEKKDKLKKDKPYKEALQTLRTACDNYQIEEIERTINEIEYFEYTADDGLVSWLRDNIDQMNYMEIVERLAEYA